METALVTITTLEAVAWLVSGWVAIEWAYWGLEK